MKPRKIKTTEKRKPSGKARVCKFKALNGKSYSLTVKQKMFCDLFLQYRGNGVDAIIGADYSVNYKNQRGNTNLPNRRLAASMASEYLTKPNILAYINLKLEESGFTDDNVRKHHLFLLNQFSNLSVKAKAIDMFYKIRGYYAPKKFEHNVELENALDRLNSILPK